MAGRDSFNDSAAPLTGHGGACAESCTTKTDFKISVQDQPSMARYAPTMPSAGGRCMRGEYGAGRTACASARGAFGASCSNPVGEARGERDVSIIAPCRRFRAARLPAPAFTSLELLAVRRRSGFAAHCHSATSTVLPCLRAT